jgi:hypothetical protein
MIACLPYFILADLMFQHSQTSQVWQDGGTARLRRKLVRLSGAGNPARGLAFSQSSRLKAAAENHRAAQRNKNLVIQAFSLCVLRLDCNQTFEWYMRLQPRLPGYPSMSSHFPAHHT